jgi:hypothetical protein
VIGFGLGSTTRTEGQEVFDFPDVEPPAIAVPQVQAQAAEGADAENPQLAFAMQQLRPVLIVELSFAKRTAQLDDDQVAKLVEQTKVEFKKVAANYAKNQNHFQGVMFFGNGPVQEQAKDPRQAIAEAVAAQVEPIAREEQLVAFRREADARQEFRKQASLDQLVTLFDEALMFTPEQRKKIRESLDKKYQPVWADNVEAIGQFSQGYYPVVPDAVVTPHLTDDQKRVWQRMQKVRASVGLGNNMWGSSVIDDIDLGKDFMPEPAQVEAAPAMLFQ